MRNVEKIESLINKKYEDIFCQFSGLNEYDFVIKVSDWELFLNKLDIEINGVIKKLFKYWKAEYQYTLYKNGRIIEVYKCKFPTNVYFKHDEELLKSAWQVIIKNIDLSQIKRKVLERMWELKEEIVELRNG